MSAIPQLNRTELEELSRRAIQEDLGETGDITTKRIIRIDQPAVAVIVSKSEGILAGEPVAEAVFQSVDKSLGLEWLVADGTRLEPGTEIGRLTGRARAIFAGERVALNFLQHLSGVATLTSKFVQKASKHGVKILCTRKTLPGLRAVQRYAVAIGGGQLHRAGLYDAILIKTNHEILAGSIREAVSRTKANPNLVAEVEVRGLGELEEAISAGADRILLDNADPATIKEAVSRAKGRVFLEISGGVTLQNVASLARLKPDAISVGALTHSATAVDISLQMKAAGVRK